MDADDTLWENNIYFERAIASFISLLDHHEHSGEQIRSILNACEHETISRSGYGVASFEISLLRCFEKVSGNVASTCTSRPDQKLCPLNRRRGDRTAAWRG